ncbi:[citrate (pro-3S)-lyase] ligase [Limisalsivibrio acetivorans]|uniref:[citrate (pro-3S)-lyase] ligase n=1 Tax=Limisalsivibrio acetivorans TaxID=1304888 RepID=UPI0003B7357A|nr:citrate lyase ligase [Limisalsivibrio acetivorans]
MVTELLAEHDRQSAKELLSLHGLSYEADHDRLVGIFENRRLTAVGARAGNILKMFAVHPDCSSTDAVGDVATSLVQDGFDSGVRDFFLFTKPEYAVSFSRLNFHPLARHEKAVMMEYGRGISRYLNRHRELVHKPLKDKGNGGIVMNCNPFTMGHRKLIEEAASRSEHLYIFVVQEDASSFPFDVRLKLVEDGTEDLDNVTVMSASSYAVSGITFPSYFLKSGTDTSSIQMEMDLDIFCRHIAPFFHIGTRYAGSEPYCGVTCAYNEAMGRSLRRNGMEFCEIERYEQNGIAVSASAVREALRINDFDRAKELVPASTWKFLSSEAGFKVVQRLKERKTRH